MKIIHILTGQRNHLVPQIVESFLINIKREQVFVFINGEANFNIYKEILSKYENNSGQYYNDFFDFFLKNNIKRHDLILLHGVSLWWMIYFALFRFSNVHNIYWGGRLNFKSNIRTFIKKIIYGSFKSLITLMEPDRISLSKGLGMGIDNIKTIPYIKTKTSSFNYEKHISEDVVTQKMPIVYLGNNTNCCRWYLYFLDVLSRFSHKLIVHCMLNYNIQKAEPYLEKIKEKGEKYFDNNFYLDTKLYTLEEYPYYMNKCDIYICPNPEQSGLAAIYTTLRLGKKIYLTGKNYEWIKLIGCHVLDTKEIDLQDIDEFAAPLPSNVRNSNFVKINNYRRDDISRWEDFFHRYCD